MNLDRGPARTIIRVTRVPDAPLAAPAVAQADRVLPALKDPAPGRPQHRKRSAVVPFVIAALAGAGLVFALVSGAVPGVKISFAQGEEAVSR